jgi:dTDP-4-dehydrorhamnose reductase
MTKILILGSTGMLGNTLLDFLNVVKDFKILAQKRQSTFIEKEVVFFDVNDNFLDESIQKIKNFNPDFIINCIANVNLEFCENNIEVANFINSDFIKLFAKEFPSTHFIQISTDSVFDGKKGNYLEEDKPNPLNEYAKSKLKAEEIVKNKFKKYTIIRTNIYGKHKNLKSKSLAEWAIEELNNNRIISGFHDVFFNPLHTLQLSKVIYKLIRKPYVGIINAASNRLLSKYEFLHILVNELGYDNNLLKKFSVLDYNSKVIRPLNTTLNPYFLKNKYELEFKIEEGVQLLK